MQKYQTCAFATALVLASGMLAVAREPIATPTAPAAITVPSNTLGPGIPMWMRREREQAESRRAVAEADYAEARADLARVEAQRAAEDRYSSVATGLVIYGPHRPGLRRALINRPTPPAVISRPTQPQGDDLHAAAQREFSRAATPPIGPIVESQLEAQRRIGAASTPPVVELQKQRDDAVLQIRKAR